MENYYNDIYVKDIKNKKMIFEVKMVRTIRLLKLENYWEIKYFDFICEENKILIIPIIPDIVICIS